MKTFREFITEGNWSQPDSLPKAKKLVKLLKTKITKKDSNKLYDLIGDDDFFDGIYEMGDDEDVSQYARYWVRNNWLKKMNSLNWVKKWDEDAIKYLEKNI